MTYIDWEPEDPNDALVDDIARQIRKKTAQTTETARARVRALVAQYSHLGPEVDALLAEALDDMRQVPDYLEATFRRKADSVLGKNEAPADAENMTTIDVIPLKVQSEEATDGATSPGGTHE